MTLTRRTRTFAALAAASALALSACGGDDDSSGDDSSTSASSSESSATDEESDDGETETEETESEDTETEESETESETEESEEGDDAASGDAVTASKSQLTFELPDGWETVDPNELLKDTGNAPQSLKDQAEASGQSLDQLLKNLASTVDVMAMGETKSGFTENINVIPQPQTMTESTLKTSYEQQGGKVTGSEEIDTSVGSAPAVTYTMSGGSGLSVRGAAVAIPTDEGSAIITVSTLDDKATEEILDTITESVKKA